MKNIIILLVISPLIMISCSSKTSTTPIVAEPTPVVVGSTADPYFSLQWHLVNTGQVTSGIAGNDINVSDVWDGGTTGSNINVAIVDNGIDSAHEDLTVSTTLSYNFCSGSDGASCPSSDHGTSVAGIVGAVGDNGIGVKGVAPAVSLVDYNVISTAATNILVAEALTKNSSSIHVSSNSWGFYDFGHFNEADSSWKTAVETGLSSGRDGKGTIYVWAGGNGGNLQDDSNYDGYANFYGVMAVAASGPDGVKADYSEKGANLWVTAPSLGDSGDQNAKVGITTTDRSGNWGYNYTGNSVDIDNNNYTQNFSGTSASAPILSGVVALVLEANAALSWRDVKIIIAKSAEKISPSDSGWITNSAGYTFNHSYGFGRVDASAAVNLAKTWTNVGTLKTYETSEQVVGQSLASDLTSTISVSSSGISKIEYIEIISTITHSDWGDLTINLSHNNGTDLLVTSLSSAHHCFDESSPSSPIIVNCNVPVQSSSGVWTFGVSMFLGESPTGDWILSVGDSFGIKNGTFEKWKLKFYGE